MSTLLPYAAYLATRLQQHLAWANSLRGVNAPNHDWALNLCSPSVVHSILQDALLAIREGGVDLQDFAAFRTEDLVAAWSDVFEKNSDEKKSMSRPESQVVQMEIVANLASSVVASHNNGVRWQAFRQNGIPAGLAHPTYTGAKKKWEQEITWDRKHSPQLTEIARDFEARMRQLPRRKQSLRASETDLDDLQQPHVFTGLS